LDSIGEMQIKDYFAMLGRRRWGVVFTVLAVACTTSVVALKLPDFYKTETTIGVDPQKVSDAYIPSTVTSSVADRLSVIRQQALSPSRLRRLIQQLGLYKNEIAQKGEDAVIDKAQTSVSLEVIDNGGGMRLSAFKVGFTDGDPQVAARMANGLADSIISENTKARRKQFSGTTTFLDHEVEETKKQLDAKQAEVNRIQSENLADLPESQQFHIQKVSNLNEQLRQLQDRINNDQTQKMLLQSSAGNDHPAVDADSNGSASEGTSVSSSAANPDQIQIQKLETKLAELRIKYGPSHPDVRSVQKDLDALKAKVAKEEQQEAKAKVPEDNSAAAVESKSATKSRRNPVLEAEINKYDQDIAEANKQREAIQKEIDFHNSKLQTGPIFAQRIANVMRDYHSLETQYSHLYSQKLTAGMAEELDDKQEGEHYFIMDTAPVPTSPAGPKRALIMLAGLFGGLAAGIALSLAKELTAETVRTEQEAVQILGKPVLAGVPVITTSRRRARRAAAITGGLIGTAVLSTALGFLIIFVTRHFS
jgi:polysaccharide chain length determinant protein (PEP-CTERM system associated)